MEAIAFSSVIVVLFESSFRQLSLIQGKPKKGLFEEKRHAQERENFPSFWVLRRFLLNN
jgi:hypothetical protein